MAEPSPQNIQPQVSQVQPTALAQQQTSQQQPFHPMVVGQNYTPPPPFPSQATSVQEKVKTQNMVTISSLSLLAITSSLIFLGAFTFLGGFLLGMWLGKPTYLMTLGRETSPLSAQPREAADSQAPAEAEEEPPTSQQEKSKGLADVVGATTEKAISKAKMPHVPKFLEPLLKEAQEAVGKQAEHRAKQITQQAQKFFSKPSASSKTSPPTRPTGVSSQSPTPSPQTSAPAPTPSTAQDTSTTSASLASHKEEEMYTVQLGVYAAKENADALRNHLQALNYTTDIKEGKSAEGDILYHVHSGRYDNYATASEVAAQFASQNIMPGAIVVKLSKNGKDGS